MSVRACGEVQTHSFLPKSWDLKTGSAKVDCPKLYQFVLEFDVHFSIYGLYKRNLFKGQGGTKFHMHDVHKLQTQLIEFAKVLDQKFAPTQRTSSEVTESQPWNA